MINEQKVPDWWNDSNGKAIGGNTNTVTPQKKKTTGGGRTATPKLDMTFPDDGLHYGMMHNAYVKQVQKDLGMPPNLQTGNFLDKTSEALYDFLTIKHDKEGKRYSDLKYPTDFKTISYQMYLDILNVDENGHPRNSQPKEVTPTTQSGTTNNTTTTQQTQTSEYSKGDVSFPMFLGQGDPKEGYNPATWGRFIEPLQNIVHAKSTGILDQQTFAAIDKYINDPKYKEFFTEPIDSESLSLLRNQAKPGISTKLYNTIIKSNDLRILKNRQADNPNQIMEEVSRMHFKLKRFFKK